MSIREYFQEIHQLLTEVDDLVKSSITRKRVPEGAQILRNEAYF